MSHSTARIALVGDYHAEYAAHQGIPRSLTLLRDEGQACEWEWVHTSALLHDPAPQLSAFHGLWCVPGSPYANQPGVIAAIRIARRTGMPFLGTCGGFQHAMLEYAEAEWGVPNAVHAEDDPDAIDPILTRLVCPLLEESREIRLEPRSRLAAIYAAESAIETYHCSFSISPKYAARLETGLLGIGARDATGDIRAVELDGHPFFFGTLFQPERAGLAGTTHPLISAFVAACRLTVPRR